MGLLTFDNDAGTKAGTKAGTYRNQTLDKKSKFMFLLIFYGLKWRRDLDSCLRSKVLITINIH